MRLRYLLLALALIGLTTWLAFIGPHSTAAPASTDGNRFPRQAAAPTLTTPEHNASVTEAYGKLPLQFEINEGQSDARVKFLARGSGYNLFLTDAEVVLALSKSTALDPIETEPAEAVASTAGRDKQIQAEAQARTKTQSVVRIRLLGANPTPGIEGEDQLPGKVNYFVGNDPAKWRPGIATYARVDYKEVYPGVDAVYYGNQGQLEYDLVVAPGTNPGIIRLKYDGPKSIRMDQEGSLVVHTDAGDLRQQKPHIYQWIGGVKKNVGGGYVIRGKNKFGFKISQYDHRHPLIIDPILTYSTYLGGNGSDQGLGIALDSAGNAYVTGFVGSGNFPTQNPIQTAQTAGDAFVAKLNSSGTALVYSTYLGGAASDLANGIAVDASGNAYVTGRTDSFNFPVAAAIQAAKSGSPFFKSTNGGGAWTSSASGLAGANVRDIAVNPTTPATIYTATEIGVFKSINGGVNWSATGLFNTYIDAVAIDSVTTTTLYAGGSGGAYKTADGGNNWNAINNGLVFSGSIPFVNALVVDPTNPSTLYAGTSGGVFRGTNAGANWIAVNNGLTATSGNSTFVPTVNALAIDPTNSAVLYAGTSNGFFRSTNSGSNWGTFNNGLTDIYVNAIVVDPTNSATLYVATFSGVFKSVNGGNSWTIMNSGLTNTSANALILDSTNSATIYAGTSGGVFKSVDGAGNWSAFNNGLTTLNISALALDRTTPANVFAGTTSSSDAFVTKLNPSGSALLYSTYLGGTDFDQGNGIALDPSANAYVTGETSSTNFFIANPRQAASGGFTDAFVTKLNSTGAALYSTYLGGNSVDQGRGIAVDASGNAYVTGNTFSTNFPTASALQAANGGSYDAFVTKLNSIGSALVYSTYLGGSSSDVGRAIAVDSVGQSYVTGETSSTNFPTTSPLQSANGGFTDAFVTKLNSNGTGRVYSSYLGGISTDQGLGIAADASGNAYVTGQTFSSNFPLRGALQATINTTPDAFVSKLNPAGSAFAYSTFLGGNSSDLGRAIAVDGSGNAYVTGQTFSTNFPTANPVQSTNRGSYDAFIVKLGTAADLSITMTDSPDPITSGSNLTYTITVTNNGEANATGVKVTDPLPSNVTFVSANSSQGGCTQSSGTVTCNLLNLNNGSSATVTIVVTTVSSGTITNTATVVANEPDPNTVNNTATQTTSVNAADLSVTMSDSPDPVASGANLTYSIPVRNNGPQQALNVVLTDTLPAGVTFVSALSTQGSCSQTTGTVTCNIGALANGVTVTVTIVVIPTRGTITNTAKVTSGNPDVIPGNNTAFQSTTVTGGAPTTNPDSKGTNFWLTFPGNYETPEISLFITGDVNTSGTVSLPGSGFSAPFTVTAGAVTTVSLPSNTDLDTSDLVENKGIQVTALDEVSVYGLNRVPFTTDAFLGLPADILKNEYLVLSYRGFSNEFAIVGTADATAVTITPTVTVGLRTAGVPYNITLNQGQTYQLRDNSDPGLSGTIISTNKPVAVFGGNQCANVPPEFFACDHLVEQLTPTETWGKSFVTMPLATRLNGDTFRFLASTNGTTVSVNGSAVATLNRGQVHERIINGPAQITSTQPILVAQYSNGSSYDGVTSDPFMMLIPPYEQFLDKYTVTTPATGFSNFINVVVFTSAVGTITLDGAATSPGSFVPIGSSGFSGAQLAVSSGSHRLSGALPFGAFVYGFAAFDSYGYPGGLSLSPIARVASVTLSPKTSSSNVRTQHCETASVKDQNNTPLADIRVDFNVTGANQTTGFANTNTSGQAQFCYTGTIGGNDTIVASVGSFSDNATHTWSAVKISGRVTDPANNGINGVTVTLGGFQTGSTTTDGNGNYSLPNLTPGGSYTVTPSQTGSTFTPPSQSFNTLNADQTANFTGPATAISGRVTDVSNNGLSGVQVVLSGTLTRVVQTDANGNYSFNNLVGGSNYSVIASSPLYVFTPPRFDFTNLIGIQIANFAQVPNVVPSPTPALVDDFGGAQRDPAKWNLGTATQPAGAFDPQVNVAQTNGQLVITPRSNASGLHYNGYTSVNAFNLTGGKASVEVAKAATGGADTIFAIGKDSNNFFRFMVHTAGMPSGLAPKVKNQNDIEVQTDPTLLLQVVIAGQLTTLDVAYDPVQHHFMRFRHESAQVSPPAGAIVFEASPDDINYTPLRKTPLDRGLDPMTIELSAGTAGSTNTDAAKFDNVKLVLSTFQFSSGAYSVGEGAGSILITVTRVGDTSTQGTVDFTTADGTAVQGSKYTRTTGKLTFAANETTKTFSVPIIDNILADGNQTLDLVLSEATTAGLNSPGRAVLTIVDNETVLTASQAEIKTWTFQGTTSAYLKLLFPNAGYRVANWGQAVRSGNDFTADAVVEKLAGVSVQSGTTTAGIYDLGPLAPGSYNFTFKNSGVVVKTLAFTVAAPPFPANPIDSAREFVRQQYRDFLNREADQAGEDFWTDNITKCSDPARRPPGQTEAQCTTRQRETTSGAFFQSPEFQYTGYYVLRMYKGALGRQPKLSEFTPDAQFVGAGILVNSQLSAAKINQNKADFATQFVNCTDATKSRCAEFKTIYDGLNNQQYVDALFVKTGANPSASERAALVNGLNANPATETRASVLQKVVDGVTVLGEGNQQFNTTYGQAFYTAESNRAFVQLEYFGYMKRDPDDAGYAFWLGKLNQFSGNFVNAEMVLAFISSPEYRARFGQP